jgi:WD40 repeat protein
MAFLIRVDVASAAPHRSRKSRWTRTGGAILSAAFSPDGRYLVAGAETYINSRGHASIWDLHQPGSASDTIVAKGTCSVAFSPDGTNVALSGTSDIITVWNVNSRTSHKVKANGEWVTSIAFTPDSRCLVAASPSGEIKFIDFGSNEQLGAFRVEEGIRRVGFFPERDDVLVVSSMSDMVRIWRY